MLKSFKHFGFFFTIFMSICEFRLKNKMPNQFSIKYNVKDFPINLCWSLELHKLVTRTNFPSKNRVLRVDQCHVVIAGWDFSIAN